MTTQQKIDVMQASLAGKTIEFRHRRGDVWLTPSAGLSWDFASYVYRVKPEPVKVTRYIIIDRDRDQVGNTFLDWEMAEDSSLRWSRDGGFAPYRVVEMSGEYIPDA